jgi:endo-1,4-beta-xylanase
LRGHNLVWHQTAPAWFFAGNTSDPGYPALVQGRLEAYITAVVSHFKGAVYCWDVVNECTSDDASSNYRTTSPWYTALGPSYIEIALRAARAADPSLPLFINDYSTEDPAKRARLLAIVADLQSKGVPLDGIGHQLHLSLNSTTAAAVDQALADVEAKGLINHVTELDISLYADPGSCYSSGTGCAAQLMPGTQAYVTALQSQALLYRALYSTFVNRASVKSVTTWGVADNHTWLDTYPVTRTNYPLLFDTSGNPKSAFWAVVDPSFVA